MGCMVHEASVLAFVFGGCLGVNVAVGVVWFAAYKIGEAVVPARPQKPPN